MSALPLTAIPEPAEDDDDDVQWALSTARALLSAGNVDEALDWLRRAGETATDVDQDMRAVELFKAAATIRSTMPPPADDGPPSEPKSYIRDIRRAPSSAPPPPPVRAARKKPSLRAIPPPPPPPSSRPIEARAAAQAAPKPTPTPTKRPSPKRPPANAKPGRVVPSIKDTQVGLGQVTLREVGDDSSPESQAPASSEAQAQLSTGALEDRGSLWAIRFAVIESKHTGRVVLSTLRSDEEPPRGVPSAVIVPRSAWDAERILRMLAKGQGA